MIKANLELVSSKNIYFSNMSNPRQLPLFNKLYILIKLLYKTTHNMPKKYKYSIGNESILIAWKCLDLFIEANSLPNNKKHSRILKLSQEFDKLKMRFRMMHEIDIITLGQFTHWQENYIQPIGVMLGGWLRWAKSAEGQ